METNEAFQVTSTSANSVGAVTAGRFLGSAAGATSTSAAKLMVIGNAAGQGASSGTAMVVQRASLYNFLGFSISLN
jgi:hypothetical protein